MSEEKKISRRNFLRIGGLVGGAAALAACAQPTAPAAPAAEPTKAAAAEPTKAPEAKPAGGVTVKIHAISGGSYDELYKIIPDWEAKTGNKTEFVFKGNGFETDKRLVQDFAANTVDYDVCWDHSSFFSQYVKAGGIEPLEGYWTQDELKDFIPRLVDATRTDGHLWVMPRHYDISCTHIRTDLGDYKAPETWDAFKEQAIKMTDSAKGVYGTQFAGKEEALTGRFYEVMTAEGGQLFNDKWQSTINSPAGVKAATMFADLYKAKAMPAEMTNFLWEDVAKNFANGIIGQYTEWFGWYGFFQDPANSKVAEKFDLGRQPKGDGNIHSGWAGHHGFSITKAAKQKEAAADLIKWLTSVEGNRLEGKMGILVSRQSVWDELIKEAEGSTRKLDKARLELALMEAKEDFKTPPLIAEWLPMSNIFYPIMQKIILGDVAAQAGLDDAAAQINKMMADAGYKA